MTHFSNICIQSLPKCCYDSPKNIFLANFMGYQKTEFYADSKFIDFGLKMCSGGVYSMNNTWIRRKVFMSD